VTREQLLVRIDAALRASFPDRAPDYLDWLQPWLADRHAFHCSCCFTSEAVQMAAGHRDATGARRFELLELAGERTELPSQVPALLLCFACIRRCEDLVKGWAWRNSPGAGEDERLFADVVRALRAHEADADAVVGELERRFWRTRPPVMKEGIPCSLCAESGTRVVQLASMSVCSICIGAARTAAKLAY
jgi:hypothetical protein